jgi:uncharacterized protein DUF1416
MTSVEGVVVKGGNPVLGAYVRLLGPSGDFVGEKRTLEDGAFRFNVAPGTWTLRWFTPEGKEGETETQVAQDAVAKVEITLD